MAAGAVGHQRGRLQTLLRRLGMIAPASYNLRRAPRVYAVEALAAEVGLDHERGPMADHPADRALSDLVRERGRHLTSYAFLLTGDSAAAQDLVQDALIKVFLRSRPGFQPDVAEAYVRRAILTLFVDGFRRRRRWDARLHLVAAPEHSDGPELRSAERVDLHAALGTLTRQERAVVVLRYFEDLPLAEVASQMNLATGTVKRYLSNAVHKLESRLGPLEAPVESDSADVLHLPVRPTTPPRR